MNKFRTHLNRIRPRILELVSGIPAWKEGYAELWLDGILVNIVVPIARPSKITVTWNRYTEVFYV